MSIKKRRLAGLMTHQYNKLLVTIKMWMQFNVMPCRSLGVDAVVCARALNDLIL